MLKIDCHTHIMPENWPDLQEKYGYGGWMQVEHHGPGCARMVQEGKLFRQIELNSWDADKRLEECDATGVDVQVLSTVPVLFNYWARAQDTLDFSRYLNDHLAGVVERYPKRFIALGTVPMQEPEYAIKELERCMRELGMAGIEIGSHINGRNLDDPRVVEIFTAAQDLGAAIFVHPWDMLGRERMSKYWLPWLVGMPAETSLAVCCMIFGGVLEKLPKLRVCYAHGGGAFPASLGRIEHGFHVRPDLVAVNNSINPREYLGKFYVDSLVHDPDFLRYMIKLMGANTICLGSDYPYPLGEHVPGRMIESMGLDRAVTERLLHGSALEWLGLDKARFAAGEAPKTKHGG